MMTEFNEKIYSCCSSIHPNVHPSPPEPSIHTSTTHPMLSELNIGEAGGFHGHSASSSANHSGQNSLMTRTTNSLGLNCLPLEMSTAAAVAAAAVSAHHGHHGIGLHHPVAAHHAALMGSGVTGSSALALSGVTGSSLSSVSAAINSHHQHHNTNHHNHASGHYSQYSTGGNSHHSSSSHHQGSSGGNRHRRSRSAVDANDLIRRSRYQCPICLKAFSEKGNMKRHTQIHLQQRHRYMCDLCSKCFSWKDNFNRHRRTHHI